MLSQWLFRRLSTKLAATMLIMLLLSISVTSFMYYQDSTKIISGHVREATQQSAKQSADYLSLILTVASDISQQISRDATVHRVIEEEAGGNLTVDQKFKIKETVDQTLNNVVYTNTFIRSIYLLKEQGSSWGSGLFNISKVRRYTLNDHEWYTNIVSNQVDELWLPLQLDPFSGGGENTELVFTYVKPLRNLYTRETVGAIVINLDGHVILQAIERIRLGKTGKFFVVNAENEKMIEANPEDWSDELLQSDMWHEYRRNENVIAEFEVELDDIPYYIVTHKMERDWLIVGAVPIGEIIGDIQNIQQKIWIYAIGLLLLASLISWLFSKRITSPLKRLMKQMERIEKSNFTAITDIRSKDEIGQLSLKFNKMVKQIEYLIEQVNEVEAKKREAEIRALRHQINPHFLYNTLSTIRWMVKLKAYDGVYNGISALVQLMEASMEKKGPFITLRDELDLLEKYMIIQKFRYGSHLQLELSYDERLLSIQLPRMLLQPIVENAVFHGIAPKETGGTVHVTIEESADKSMLLVTIKDDGIGIAEEKLSELLSGAQQTRAGMFGIGLMHVHETIQLYYGLQSGLHIESSPHEGTTIRLQLAVKEVGEGDI